ncbi:MAG: glutamine-hydrolyzing carbamoyl-phosphate synthase small subunit [Mailhella sp.]|nr:glutamine-hydrolyzing carbamoyl-phosphate synthase small subunit [Mailhella sp.]
MKALIILEDGFALTGESFTGEIPFAGGEAIFNTSMTGYQEILSDPSYCGQIVCMTYPLIGNYGINPDDMESAGLHLSAFVVKECCKNPSNWRCTESLPDFLKRFGVPGIEGVDTRALALHLRQNGAMRAGISTSLAKDELLEKVLQLPSMNGLNLVEKAGAKNPYAWDNAPIPAALNADGTYSWKTDLPHVVVYDYGIKWNILRLLTAAGMEVLAVPPLFSVEQVRAVKPDGIFLSNGPGDPSVLNEEISIIRELIDLYPVAGICLGHQLIAHATGGHTEKLKFGHHGVNHPVKDIEVDAIVITSQNHGFHVVPGEDMITTHYNLNDGTIEGCRHKTKPVISVQHHPEAAAGPRECKYFIDEFRKLMVQ